MVVMVILLLDDLLQIRQTANFDGFDGDYDIRIFDSPSEMREELRKLNKINNKSRMVADTHITGILKKSKFRCI